MPTTVAQIINQAFQDLKVIQAGDSITGLSMETGAFQQLNFLMDAFSSEELTVPNEVRQTFPLIAGQPEYTLGVGGIWNVNPRAVKVRSWMATFGTFRNGGLPLPLPVFATQAKDPVGSTASIPLILGADNAFPLINIHVFPTPGAGPGSMELLFWQAIAQFAATSDTITLPPGWFELLHWNLAEVLYPAYARVAQTTAEIVAAESQKAKQRIAAENPSYQAVLPTAQGGTS
jgi:hypothetical protein